MAKKNKVNPVENETVIDRDIKDEMEESSLSYAIKTITDRALPDARDGLKPVLRRILYAMHKQGLKPDAKYLKNADIVGYTMGKFHPHGDGSIYGVISSASQDWNYRYPLVDFQGNNGSIDGDGAAAYRYTEGKMDKKALMILRDVDKETVDFKPNYAETMMEPTVLPALFPNLLANGVSGIATGYTTEIPSHNLTEIIDAIIATIKKNDITVMELLKYIKGPDFAIGGQLIYNDRVRELYETGKASLNFRGTFKVETNDETDNTQIVFDSIPPDVNKPKLIEKLYELCIDKKEIPRVIDVRDESEGNEIRIVLELHKTAVPDVVVAEVYNRTPLEKSKGFIMRALVDQAPKVLNLRTIMDIYINHQRDVITRRSKYDLNKAKERLHILEGFEKILANIDEVIKIIRASDTTQDAATNLKTKYTLTDAQVKPILEMPLRRLTKLEGNKILTDIAELKTTIAYFENILSAQIEVDKVLIDELKELRKAYGDKRRTQIVTEEELNNAASNLVTDEEMVTILTTKNTIKQIPISALEEMQKGGFLRERKEVFIQGVKCTIADEFIVIFENGEYTKCGFNDLVAGLPFAEERKLVAIVKNEPETEKSIAVVTKQGYIIKTLMKSFKARQRRIATLIKSKEEGTALNVIGVRVTEDNEDDIITVVTDQGVVHRWFYGKAFTPSNPGAVGVPCISTSIIQEGQEVVDFAISKNTDDEVTKVLLYLEDAQGIGIKTMGMSEFKPKGRVSKGINGTEFRRGKGKVHKMKVAKEDFFVIDEKGQIHNQKFVSVTPQNRYNKPVEHTYIPVTTEFYIQ